MARLDIEAILDRVVAMYKDNINARLTAICTEKGDGMVMADLKTGAFFIQEMNGEMANYDPFCVVSIEDIQSVGRGPASADAISIVVAICLADNGEDTAISRRMFRYGRALREVFEQNWSDTQTGIKFEIETLVPDAFKLLDSENLYKVIGLRLRATIG